MFHAHRVFNTFLALAAFIVVGSMFLQDQLRDPTSTVWADKDGNPILEVRRQDDGGARLTLFTTDGRAFEVKSGPDGARLVLKDAMEGSFTAKTDADGAAFSLRSGDSRINLQAHAKNTGVYLHNPMDGAPVIAGFYAAPDPVRFAMLIQGPGEVASENAVLFEEDAWVFPASFR